MKIAKRHILEQIRPGIWDKLAEENGFGARLVKSITTELADAEIQPAKKVAEELAPVARASGILAISIR